MLHTNHPYPCTLSLSRARSPSPSFTLYLFQFIDAIAFKFLTHQILLFYYNNRGDKLTFVAKERESAKRSDFNRKQLPRMDGECKWARAQIIPNSHTRGAKKQMPDITVIDFFSAFLCYCLRAQRTAIAPKEQADVWDTRYHGVARYVTLAII